jgi:hypothetical protein
MMRRCLLIVLAGALLLPAGGALAGPVGPDLSMTVNDNVGGVAGFPGQWNWTIRMTNTGTGDAVFPDLSKMFNIDFPTANVQLSYIDTSFSGGVTGNTTINCVTSFGTFYCLPAGGTLTFPPGEYVDITVTVTPSAIGTYSLPRGGGSCSADPDSAVAESNEGNNTCSGSMTVLPAGPQLGEPANGLSITGRPKLRWKSIANARRYQVQVDDDAAFGSPVVDATTKHHALNLAKLPAGVYHWRVRAFVNGAFTTFSTPRTFTVG